MTQRRPLALLLAVLTMFSCSSARSAEQLPQTTALDAYLNREDASYRWEIVAQKKQDGVTLITVDMVSQTWRTKEEVNRTEWQHWVQMAIPDDVQSDTGFLMIGGGSNNPDDQPGFADPVMVDIARKTRSVVTELKMVPNQALIFHGDGKKRKEDDLIGYTWDQFLKTGDPTWPARNPMIKSAKRAMDTITAVMASEAGGRKTVNKFVVAGGSKRGWTTWLTGLDKRVAAIIPIVIDVLNADQSMRHHFAAYGFWAPAVGNYVQHRIMHRLDHPRLKELYQLVDPYFYRHRLTMPKYIVNGSGDQFFLPDSSRFYFDDLVGEKYLRYVPNADHGLGGSDAIESITAFYALILAGRDRPQFSWTNEADGSIKVTTQDKPAEVLLWQAHNPDARDFRIETLGAKYTSSVLQDQGNGVYVGNVAEPEQGWTAYYVELKYDVGVGVPLKLSTGVRVVPDVLPYKDKASDQPTHITIVCDAPSEQAASTLIALGRTGGAQRLQVDSFRCENFGTRCFFNWVPRELNLKAASQLGAFLEENGCSNLKLQLESGDEITGMPQQ